MEASAAFHSGTVSFIGQSFSSTMKKSVSFVSISKIEQRDAPDQIVGRTNVKSASGIALQNVKPDHEGNGRPVRARTADLHRVNLLVG
jgi:hypothetical protein